MRRHLRASSAASIQAVDLRKAGIGLLGLAMLGLVAFLGIGAPSAGAIDTCPNVVFRTGPSAKLPDCRAYELVSPVDEHGLRPTGGNAFNEPNSFEFPLLSDNRDSVIFNTSEGTITGFPGNGFEDRYRAKRTATGWETEYFGPTAEQSSRPLGGAVASDHSYEFVNAGSGDYNLEPESTLQAPFGGHDAEYLRTPNNEYELIGKGSLGSAQHAQGILITPKGEHIIFITATKLEPLAKETEEGFEVGNQFGTIYERSPGGPTKVLSLMPDGTTPTGTVRFVGTSTDGTDVSFSDSEGGVRRYYVRHAGTTTKEWGRDDGVQVGKKLTCNAFEGGEIQWLRNGAPIGGATNANYTPTAADEGKVIQCKVTQSGSEGTTFSIGANRALVAPFAETEPPAPAFVSITKAGNFASSAEVGDELTCSTGSWRGSPTFTYKWFRNGTEISGVTTATYTLTASDKATGIECVVTGTNSDGTAAKTSNLTRVAGQTPSASATPTLANVTSPGNAPEAGDELECAPGTWSHSPTISYEWLRNGAAIGGATSATYTLVAADEGKALQCVVTASTSEGTVQAASAALIAEPAPATSPPAPFYAPEIYGISKVGSQLFAEGGGWSGEPTLSYQWLKNGVEIAGATSNTYTPTAGDLGATIQVRITAANAGGSVVVINPNAAKYVGAAVPEYFEANFTAPGIIYAGTFNGQIFYVDRGSTNLSEPVPGDLFSYDIADGSTTRITDVNDAIYVNVSSDGSTVYFLSESEIGGEGEAGELNLYMWSRSSDSTKYVTTVSHEDLALSNSALAGWTYGVAYPKEIAHALGSSNTRTTADGSVLLFETKAQLTEFENKEPETKEAAHTCGNEFAETTGERCNEIYRYDAESEELTCISCGPGVGPATGEASMWSLGTVVPLNPMNNLSKDGSTVVFETTEGLLPQDGNHVRDVYRWKEGSGLSLISTGQSPRHSNLYAVSPEANDILFTTQEQLLPQDENGGTPRIYDARVNGGFPPPESTVTEPCGGDACQGAPAAAPESPQIASASVNGEGNVPRKLSCAKGRRLSVRGGKERCVARKHRRRHKHAHRRAGAKRRAAR